MKKVVLVCFILTALVVAQGPDALFWTTRAPAPAPARCQIQAHGNVRDTVYICGGRTAGTIAIRTVHAYVPATNTWISTLPSMPGPRSHGCGDVIDSVIYAAGGFDSTGATQTTLFAFNVNRKTWATLAPMPSAVILTAGANYGGRLYVFGSQNNGDTLYEYNPAFNTWTPRVPATRPAGRRAASAAGTANYFYLMGGIDRTNAALRDCWRFNRMGGGAWTRMTDMPGPRCMAAAYTVVGDSIIYVVGGNPTGMAAACDSIVYKYTIASDIWTTDTRMPTSRGFLTLDRSQNKIYAICGINGATYFTTNEEGGPAGVMANDVGMDAIITPGSWVLPNSSVSPEGRVKNFGTNGQLNIPVACWIDSSGTRVYTGNATILSIAPNDTARITFSPNWTTGGPNITYQVTMYTNLSTDQNRSNDTLRRNTTTFQITTTMTCPFRSVTPTFDGNIQAGEWADATRTDISDVLGRQGAAEPPGSSFLYTKHDSTFVFYALDMPNALARNNMDLYATFIDEDDNNLWKPDSSEGNYILEYAAGDSVIYVAWLNPSTNWRMPGPVLGALSVSSIASGHLQFETAVPFGSQRYQITANPDGDTLGFFAYSTDQPGNITNGWWPQTVPSTGYTDPANYGSFIILKRLGSVEENNNTTKKVEFEVQPNITKGRSTIHYYLESRSKVSLRIYNSCGELVKILVDRTEATGMKQTVFDGSNLPGGVYFFNLTTDNANHTGKILLVK